MLPACIVQSGSSSGSGSRAMADAGSMTRKPAAHLYRKCRDYRPARCPEVGLRLANDTLKRVGNETP